MSGAKGNRVKRRGNAPHKSRRKLAFRAGKGSSMVVEKGVKTSRGTEVWHVRADGKILSLTTSATSTSVMDDAVKIYSPALERLAKR
jgi:hypothetical protein